MTRIEQLTFDLADDVLTAEGVGELEILLQRNQADRQTHLSVLKIEARLRATRKNLNLSALIMEKLREGMRESVTQRVMSEIRTQSAPEGMPERSKAHDREDHRGRDSRSVLELLFGSAVRRYATAFAAVVILIGVGFYFYQRNQEAVEIGKFASITGWPALRHAGQRSMLQALPSMMVHSGDRIETGDADKAEIQFKDGTTLRLNFNTTLDIPRNALQWFRTSTLQRPPQVALLAGQVWAKVQKLTNAPQFAVQTPVAVAAVKGTEFSLRLQKAIATKPANQTLKTNADLLAILTVREGTVEFSNSYGKVNATALTETEATADSAPTQPQRVAALKTFRLNRTHLSIGSAKLILQDAPEYLVYPVGWAGITLASATPGPPAATPPQAQQPSVVRLTFVRSGSPGALAGLQAGDLINAVNGQTVTNVAQMRAAIVTGLNQPLALNIQRPTGPIAVTLVPTARPDAPALPAIPVQVQKALFEATAQLIAAGYQQRIAPGQVTEGERALEELLRNYPDAAAVHLNLGFLYESKDELGQAIRHYQRAIELDPYAALYHLNLGLALRSIGNVDRSVEELEQAAIRAPAWPLASYWLADAYSVIERHDDAAKAIEAGLKFNPLNPLLWQQKAEVLLRARQSAAALPVALKAVDLDPGLVGAHITLGNIYDDLGRKDADEVEQRKAIELAPFNDHACVNLANLLENRGRLDEAEALYRKAIDLAPDNAGALNGLGSIFFDRQQAVEAEKWYRKAVEVDPNSPEFIADLGNILRIMGRPNEGEPLLRKAIELQPGIAAPYVNLGLLCSQRRQWGEAERLLLTAAELDPGLPVERFLAEVYHNEGKLDQEEQPLRRLLARDTNDPQTCNDLAYNLADRAIKLDEALTLASRAAGLTPTNALVLDTVGWVYYQRGELDQAEAWLRKAADSSGERGPSPTLREHLKMVQEKKAKSR